MEMVRELLDFVRLKMVREQSFSYIVSELFWEMVRELCVKTAHGPKMVRELFSRPCDARVYMLWGICCGGTHLYAVGNTYMLWDTCSPQHIQVIIRCSPQHIRESHTWRHVCICCGVYAVGVHTYMLWGICCGDTCVYAVGTRVYMLWGT